MDMEAGLEHLKRGTPRHTDMLLAVAEPYFRSAETAVRVARMGEDLGIPRVGVVVNKVRDDEDQAVLREVFDRTGLDVIAVVPFDEVVARADRQGIAPIDVDASSPGVRAVERIADAIEERRTGRPW